MRHVDIGDACATLEVARTLWIWIKGLVTDFQINNTDPNLFVFFRFFICMLLLAVASHLLSSTVV